CRITASRRKDTSRGHLTPCRSGSQGSGKTPGAILRPGVRSTQDDATEDKHRVGSLVVDSRVTREPFIPQRTPGSKRIIAHGGRRPYRRAASSVGIREHPSVVE